jgi:hypothetical protein
MFKSIYDPDFKYRSADRTDLRRTFARIRRTQQSVPRRKEDDPLGSNVVPIGSSTAGEAGHWPFPG